jgi:hypothetical protein
MADAEKESRQAQALDSLSQHLLSLVALASLSSTVQTFSIFWLCRPERG